MDFTTLFRLKENLNLDKKTLAILRWIAIAGQFLAIYIVYFFLDFKFPIMASLVIILIGSISNLYLQFVVKAARIKDIFAGLILVYDLIQLSLLLYLTGGISNPFSILLIIPTIVSSTFLSMGTTIILGSFTFLCLFLLTIFHYPLPGIHENAFTFPKYYLSGFFISIIIGLIFLSYFGIRFAGETKKRSEALNKLQEIIAKEYELESLGGQAAAAAHSLGTPLATISVVVKELRNEISQDSKISKDLDLLLSQTKRCSEILKKISKKQIIEDKFFSLTKFEDLLEEIRDSPEIIYGLRNFIGNSVKFSKKI